MPRVKFDYVVSFSSEDPDNPASNLLEWEVTKKKWLCTKGEPSVSVVLQLARAVQISAVHIGAYQSALVEVLVGRSEKPDDPFEVLVPSSVFLSPSASRRDEATELVRSFSGEQLAAPAKDHKWDRVRVVCSQPYNKHCKYGLGFVQLYEPEGAARSLPLEPPSSDEEDFRPGELFAKHSQGGAPAAADSGPSVKVGADAQIRRATSQALRNVPGACAQLHRAPVAKPTGRDRGSKDSKAHSEARHGGNKRPAGVGDAAKASGRDRRESIENPAQSDRKKRSRADSGEDYVDPGPSAQPHGLLAGVVAVLSGYQHPERAAVRATALALGAGVRPDWGPHCTHLICAFPNTPKLRALRSTGAGLRVPVATADWLRECARLRRRLPWRWFATDARLRLPPRPLPEPEADAEPEPEPDTDTDCDTDDDIREALRAEDDRAYAASTDEEADAEGGRGGGGGGALPAFFDGYTFVVDRASLGEFDVALVERYIRAYGGVLLEEASDSGADFAVGAARSGTRARARERERERASHAVHPRWLWRCHAQRALLDPAPAPR